MAVAGSTILQYVADVEGALKDIAKLSKGNETAIKKVISDMKRMERDAGRALDGFAKDNKKAMAEVSAAHNRMADIGNKAFAALRRAAVGVVAVLGTRELVRYAEVWQTVQNRLKVVSANTEELRTATEGLFAIAQRTRSSFEATAELYARIARSSAQLGISQQELLDVTETINKAIQTSGATAQEASAALIQLSQGLASGALRGEELRSVLEQTPRLALALADGLGVSIGALRELGKEGKLTAEAVIGALQDQAPAIAAEFENIVPTVEQSFQTIKNALVREVGGPLSQALVPAAQIFAQTFTTFIDDIKRADSALQLFAAGGIIGLEALKTAAEIFAATLIGIEALLLNIRRASLFLRGVTNEFETVGSATERLQGELTALQAQLARESGETPVARNLRAQIAGINAELSELEGRPIGEVIKTELGKINEQYAILEGRINQLNQAIFDPTEVATALARYRAGIEAASVSTEILSGAIKNLGGDAAADLADAAREVQQELRSLSKTAGLEIDFKTTGLADLREGFDALGLSSAVDAISVLEQKLVAAGVAAGDVGNVTLGTLINDLLRAAGIASQLAGGLSSDFDNALKAVEAQFTEVQKRITALGGKNVPIELSLQGLSQAETQFDILETKLAELREQRAALPVTADTAQADQAIADLEFKLAVLRETQSTIRLKVVVGDLEQTGRELEQLIAQARQRGDELAGDPAVQEQLFRERAQREAEIIAEGNRQTVEQEAALQESLLQTKEQYIAEFQRLAYEQALAEAEARIQAETEARGGVPLTPEDELEIKKQVGERALEIFKNLETKRTQIAKKAAKDRQVIEKEEALAKVHIQQMYAQAFSTLLGGLVGESKGVALALIAIEKALAIAEVNARIEVGIAAALAQHKGNVALAAPQIAALNAQRAASIAVIAAQGITQAIGAVGGGGGGIGGGVGFANISATTIGGGLQTETERLSGVSVERSAIQVIFQGPVLASDRATREFITQTIQQAVKDEDVVIIDADSRQAIELRA